MNFSHFSHRELAEAMASSVISPDALPDRTDSISLFVLCGHSDCISELLPCRCGSSNIGTSITIGFRQRFCRDCGAEGHWAKAELKDADSFDDAKLNAAWNDAAR